MTEASDTATCEHDWHLPDPGRPWSVESPWEVFCPLCGARALGSCHHCQGAPAVEGSVWCKRCGPFMRRQLPTFEQMLASPFSQPDTEGIVYKNVVDATVALPFKPGAGLSNVRGER